MVLGVVSVLVYFLFTIPTRPPAKVGSQLGRGVLMVSFGIWFGYMVMSRVSLLVERVHFLLVDWLHLV